MIPVPRFRSPRVSGDLRSEETISATPIDDNQIPGGGFIEFSSDGRTRVFSPEGNETAYAVDERMEQVTTPSGRVLPATHIIGIPNGATIHSQGENSYITLNGEVILTIIDNSALYPSDIIGPEPVGSTWVEYAESDPYYFLGQFYSTWTIPESPDLVYPPPQPQTATKTNILFNGIELSDGTMIFQPVTAFDYKEHSSLSGTEAKLSDPAIINKWTGASWFCPQNNSLCMHSPVISFSRGDNAEGDIVWVSTLLKWLVVLNNINQGTWTSYYSDSYIVQNPYLQPFRTVVVYEWHPTFPNGQSPEDNQKLSNTFFYGNSAWDTNGLPISLNWHKTINQNNHTHTHGLDVQFLPSSVSPSQIILYTENLTAGFASDVRSGISPLIVHFYDQSTGDPTGWAWDFNNDGIVDSTTQDSEYTYTRGGTYTVKLTVTRPGQSDVELKNGYIVVNGLAVRPLPGMTNPPTDPDSDGLYEDLNGNGIKDMNDVVLIFNNLIWLRDNEPVACFDFNGNGSIDMNDVILLFKEMT
jgi:PKD repeat protein